MNHTASPVPHTRHVTGRYTLMQSSYWASYCVILTFSSVYLLHQGFRNAEIGILISVSGILSAVLQPVVSRAADNLKRMSLRQFAMVLLVVQTVFSGLLRVLTAPAAQTVLYGCLMILLQLVLPLCSALGMDCLNRGIPLNFGVARGIGSVAYGVFSALCGRLVLWLGENSLPLAMLAINLVLLLSVATFRFRTPEAAGEGETSPKAEDTPADTRLESIPGAVPHPLNLPKGCKFAPRCKYCTQKCIDNEPQLKDMGNGQLIRCFYPEKEVRRSDAHKEIAVHHES